MAKTTKSKPRRKAKIPKTADEPAAKRPVRSAGNSMETQKLATETPVGPTSQTAGSDGQHVKITPPAPTKNSGGAWFLSFIFIIVIFGTGFLTWPHWQSYVMAYVPNSFDIVLLSPTVPTWKHHACLW